MKTTTIDTAAAWAGTIATIQDGDPASEANMDLVSDSIGDRLGYLKTKADGAAYLAAATQTFTGAAVWDAANAVTIDPDGTYGLELSSGADALFNGNVEVAGTAAFQGALSVTTTGTFLRDVQTLADANSSISATYESRVPQITANRSYTLPGGGSSTLAVISASAAGWVELVRGDGWHLRVVRTRTADAFTVTILGTVGSGGAQWRVSAWGGTVTSLDTTA